MGYQKVHPTPQQVKEWQQKLVTEKPAKPTQEEIRRALGFGWKTKPDNSNEGR